MDLIARYRAVGRDGRLHLVDELVDEGQRHWLELTDGTPVKRLSGDSFETEDGQAFLLLSRN